MTRITGDGYFSSQPDAFFKGKSFNYVGKWEPSIRYFSDEYIVDFVSFENCFLACKHSHTSNEDSKPVLIYDEHGLPYSVEGDCWAFVMRGGTNKTAYDIAVEHGYKGTEEEWIKMISKQVVTGAELDPSITCAPEIDMDNVVRFDVDQTAKSEKEKAQARKNIGAAWDDDILIAEEPSTDYYQAVRTLDQIALVWEPQQLTQSQLSQAQENLHIADEIRVDILEKKMAELDEKGLTTLGNINDLVSPTYDGHTDTTTGTVPPFFVNAINNFVGLVGDPVKDNVKKAGYSTNMVETLNYLYNLCGVKILDVTPTSDKSGRIWYALCDKTGTRIPDSEIFKIPRDNEIHDVRIVEGGLDDSDPDNPKYVDGGTGHYWLRFLSGFFDETKGEWIDSEPVYCLVDRMFYVAKEEEVPYTDYTEPLSEANENPLYEGATIQATIEDDPVTGFRKVSADIIEATIDRKHLNKEGRLNYDFTGYDFTIDPGATADYYIRCAQDYPGAIRLMPSNYNEIGPKMVPPYQPGELYYTYVRHIDAAQELDTTAKTLREATNELYQRYPVTIVEFDNGVLEPEDPDDPTARRTATDGSKATYIVKQRTVEDPTVLVDVATIEIPLEHRVVKVSHIVAEGGEWLGDITVPEAERTDETLKAKEGDHILDLLVYVGEIPDPDDPEQFIPNYEHLYSETDIHDAVDEVTVEDPDPKLKMIIEDPADTTKTPVEKEFVDPEAVQTEFIDTPQIQLYFSGTDNQLSAKLLFEDDHILGKEIIP